MAYGKVLITLEGGVIQDINVYTDEDNLNLEIEVRDFDIQGIEEDQITTDDDGNRFIKSKW